MPGNLYNIIVQATKVSANGLNKNSPSTPAAALADLMRVMSPGRVENHREMTA